MKTIKKIELRVKRERLAESGVPYNSQISEPHSAVKIAQSILAGIDHEAFLALPLDIKNKVLGYVEVAKGGIDLCQVDVREVFRAALVMGASSLIVVHNHPSGDANPSEEDLNLTENICQAGWLLNVHVLDHIIVGDDSYVSLAERGLMPTKGD